MHTRELTDAEDQEFAPDPPSRRRVVGEQDPISQAIGSGVFISRYVLEACYQDLPDPRATTFPERFDRWYFDIADGGILIDIVDDTNAGGPELSAQRFEQERKVVHADFKERWCAEHGRKYICLGRQASQHPDRVRELLAERFDPKPPEPEAVPDPGAEVDPGEIGEPIPEPEPEPVPVKRGPGRPRKASA